MASTDRPANMVRPKSRAREETMSGDFHWDRNAEERLLQNVAKEIHARVERELSGLRCSVHRGGVNTRIAGKDIELVDACCPEFEDEARAAIKRMRL
jgi:hypothetical protein